MMFPSNRVRIMVATKPIDFRKGHDGLAAQVSSVLRKDPFTGTVFVFRSRRADRLKLLFWDGTGLVMAYKRLEDATFTWPAITDGMMALNHAQFEALFAGLDWRKVRRDAGLERGDRRALAFRRPRQVDAERPLRGLQFKDAGRSPERDAVLRPRSCPRGCRSLGRRLQCGTVTFGPRLPDPCGFRCPTHRNGRSAPRNGSVPPLAHCSLRASGQLSPAGSGFSWMNVGGQSSQSPRGTTGRGTRVYWLQTR
ncbi:hypothetical protein FALB51S_00095 [Frigidibacter albus]